MNKQTRNVIYGIALVLLLIGILGFFGKLPLAIYSQGFTISSISSTKIISNDADVASANFLISASLGGGQVISAVVSPSDFKQESGYTTQKSLQITSSNFKEQIQYQLRNTGEQIFQYTDTVVKSSSTCEGNYWTHPEAPNCPSGTFDSVDFKASGNFFSTYVCERHCISKTQVGVLSTIQPTRTLDSMDISLKIEGKSTITKTISNDYPNADYYDSGEYVASISYPQNGWTGNFAPDVSSFRGFYNIYQNKNRWGITSLSLSSQYPSRASELETWLQSNAKVEYSGDTPAQYYTNARNDVSNRLSKVNSIVAGIMNDDLSITQSQSWGNRNDGNNGQLTLDITNRNLAVPNFVIRLKASSVGVIINVAKPLIVSKECKDFRSGDAGKMTIGVKNTATNVDGTFTASITCGTIRQSYNSGKITIGAGQTQTIDIPLDANNYAGTKTDNCQITVRDYNKESNYDSTSVSCKILAPAQCQEGKIVSAGNCIRKCVNGVSTDLKCCKDTQTILQDNSKLNDQFNGYYCQDKTIPDEDKGGKCSGLFGGISCWFSNLFSGALNLLTYIKYLIIGIFSLIGLFVLHDSLNKNKTLKKNQLINWIMSLLIIGGIAFFLVMFIGSIYFWILLVVGGIVVYFAFPLILPLLKVIK
jgi:hypothetical protein